MTKISAYRVRLAHQSQRGRSAPHWCAGRTPQLWETLPFEIPPAGRADEPWRRCIDTFLDAPADICDWAAAQPVQGSTYSVQPRSVVLLIARP